MASVNVSATISDASPPTIVATATHRRPSPSGETGEAAPAQQTYAWNPSAGGSADLSESGESYYIGTRSGVFEDFDKCSAGKRSTVVTGVTSEEMNRRKVFYGDDDEEEEGSIAAGTDVQRTYDRGVRTTSRAQESDDILDDEAVQSSCAGKNQRRWRVQADDMDLEEDLVSFCDQLDERKDDNRGGQRPAGKLRKMQPVAYKADQGSFVAGGFHRTQDDGQGKDQAVRCLDGHADSRRDLTTPPEEENERYQAVGFGGGTSARNCDRRANGKMGESRSVSSDDNVPDDQTRSSDVESGKISRGFISARADQMFFNHRGSCRTVRGLLNGAGAVQTSRRDERPDRDQDDEVAWSRDHDDARREQRPGNKHRSTDIRLEDGMHSVTAGQMYPNGSRNSYYGPQMLADNKQPEENRSGTQRDKSETVKGGFKMSSPSGEVWLRQSPKPREVLRNHRDTDVEEGSRTMTRVSDNRISENGRSMRDLKENDGRDSHQPTRQRSDLSTGVRGYTETDQSSIPPYPWKDYRSTRAQSPMNAYTHRHISSQMRTRYASPNEDRIEPRQRGESTQKQYAGRDADRSNLSDLEGGYQWRLCRVKTPEEKPFAKRDEHAVKFQEERDSDLKPNREYRCQTSDDEYYREIYVETPSRRSEYKSSPRKLRRGREQWNTGSEDECEGYGDYQFDQRNSGSRGRIVAAHDHKSDRRSTVTRDKTRGQQWTTEVCKGSQISDDSSDSEPRSTRTTKRRSQFVEEHRDVRDRRRRDFLDSNRSSDDHKGSSDRQRRKEKYGRQFRKGVPPSRWIRPDKFDGMTPLSIFLGQMETCAHYNGWNNEDKLAHLMISLKGSAAQLLGTERNQCATYDDMVVKLRKRYGNDSQMNLFRAQLRARKRRAGEPLQSLYLDISRLAALAFPGVPTEHAEAVAVDAFIDALCDERLEVRVRDREPIDLDSAYRTALVMEANSKSKSTDEGEHENRRELHRTRVRAIVPSGTERPANSAVPAGAVTNVADTTRVDKLEVMFERMLEMQKKEVASKPSKEINQVEHGVTRRKEPVANNLCFHCGGDGHFARECPVRIPTRTDQHNRMGSDGGRGAPPARREIICYRCGQPGHIVRQCPEEAGANNRNRGAMSQPLVSRGGRKTDRAEKGFAVYLKASFRGQEWMCLLDSGCECTIVPHRMVHGLQLDRTVQSLRAANGTEIPLLGELELCLQVDGQEVGGTALVSPHIVEPMLGIDWLTKNDCYWDFGRNIISIKGRTVPLRVGGVTMSCRRVVTTSDVTISAWSEMTIDSRVELRSWKQTEVEDWCTEPGVVKQGVCVARAVMPRQLEHVPVNVINVSEEDVVLKAGAELSELTEAEILTPSEEDGEPAEVEMEHLQELIRGLDDSVTSHEKARVVSLLRQFSDVFSKDEYDLGEAILVKHRIETANAAPIRQALRRQPRHLVEQIDEQVESMYKAGVIEPSASPWSSNVVVVKKKDGTLRFCIDYRRLNEVTRKDVYPLPRIDACLDAMSGARYFSTFDLRSGYHQVAMAEEDADKTSFVTRTGSYRYKKMPFGLCNAGSTFQRLMDVVMRGANFIMCLVYLDDIIVFSTEVEEHLRRLKIIFERLRAANLKLKPSKCFLLKRKVSFLGHVISEKGVSTDSQKIEAVKDWPVPVCVKEVRAFLGLCGYYRRFVKGFADIAAPLHELTHKERYFQWSEDCQKAFDMLKVALTSSPILAMPTDEEPFVLDTDACDRSVGAVLSQIQGGEEKVICYGSRKLSRVEKNYCTTRKELLAVIFYMKTFRVYLLGRRFTVRTDHAALQWLRRMPDPVGQQARWLEIMESFDFTVIHRPGKSHANADALSRKPCRQCGREEGEEDAVKVRTITLDTPEENMDSPWKKEILAEEYRADRELAPIYGMMEKGVRPSREEMNGYGSITKAYWVQWDRLRFTDGKLYRKWSEVNTERTRWQLIPPEKRRMEIVQQAHSGITSSHLGLKRTRKRVQRNAYWVGWYGDVERVVLRCDACAKYFRGTPRRKGALQRAPVGEPWERLAIDITGPHPKSRNGYSYILTCIDLFTKYAFAFPIRNHEATTVARMLVERVFMVFGIPKQVLSDRGAEFESGLMRELCTLLEIDKLRTTSYKPSTNGAVERFHRTLNSFMGKLVAENQRDWDEWLPYVLAAYQASEHESTGFTPNYLLFGRETRVPLDLAFDCPEPVGDAPQYGDFVEEKRRKMLKSFDDARETLGVTANRSKERYDLRVRPAKFKIGDWVWYFNPRRFQGKSPKWQQMYTGPYLLLRQLGPVNWIIQKSPRSAEMVVHVDKLKYCVSVTRPSWIGEGIEEGEKVGGISDVCPDVLLVDVECGENTGGSPSQGGKPHGTKFGLKSPIARLHGGAGENARLADTWVEEVLDRPRRAIRKPVRYCNRVLSTVCSTNLFCLCCRKNMLEVIDVIEEDGISKYRCRLCLHTARASYNDGSGIRKHFRLHHFLALEGLARVPSVESALQVRQSPLQDQAIDERYREGPQKSKRQRTPMITNKERDQRPSSEGCGDAPSTFREERPLDDYTREELLELIGATKRNSRNDSDGQREKAERKAERKAKRSRKRLRNERDEQETIPASVHQLAEESMTAVSRGKRSATRGGDAEVVDNSRDVVTRPEELVDEPMDADSRTERVATTVESWTQVCPPSEFMMDPDAWLNDPIMPEPEVIGADPAETGDRICDQDVSAGGYTPMRTPNMSYPGERDDEMTDAVRDPDDNCENDQGADTSQSIPHNAVILTPSLHSLTTVVPLTENRPCETRLKVAAPMCGPVIASGLALEEPLQDGSRGMTSTPEVETTKVFGAMMDVVSTMRLPLSPGVLIRRASYYCPGIPRAVLIRTARLVLNAWRLSALSVQTESRTRVREGAENVRVEAILTEMREAPVGDAYFWEG